MLHIKDIYIPSHRVHARPAVVNMHQIRVPGDVKAPAQRRVLVAVHLPHVNLASTRTWGWGEFGDGGLCPYVLGRRDTSPKSKDTD